MEGRRDWEGGRGSVNIMRKEKEGKEENGRERKEEE